MPELLGERETSSFSFMHCTNCTNCTMSHRELHELHELHELQVNRELTFPIAKAPGLGQKRPRSIGCLSPTSTVWTC